MMYEKWQRSSSWADFFTTATILLFGGGACQELIRQIHNK